MSFDIAIASCFYAVFKISPLPFVVFNSVLSTSFRWPQTKVYYDFVECYYGFPQLSLNFAFHLLGLI